MDRTAVAQRASPRAVYVTQQVFWLATLRKHTVYPRSLTAFWPSDRRWYVTDPEAAPCDPSPTNLVLKNFCTTT